MYDVRPHQLGQQLVAVMDEVVPQLRAVGADAAALGDEVVAGEAAADAQEKEMTNWVRRTPDPDVYAAETDSGSDRVAADIGSGWGDGTQAKRCWATPAYRRLYEILAPGRPPGPGAQQLGLRPRRRPGPLPGPARHVPRVQDVVVFDTLARPPMPSVVALPGSPGVAQGPGRLPPGDPACCPV